MPLHLLPKKSWNVYNTDNVERVRRDEEIARKKEEEEEMKMQQEDAERRMMELRKRALERQGGIIPSIGGSGGGAELPTGGFYKGSASEGSVIDQSGTKQIEGRNKVERVTSYTTETACVNGSMEVHSYAQELKGDRKDSLIDPQVHQSLTDKSGHFNLFSEHPSGPRKLSRREKNPEFEEERLQKGAKIAEQFNMALGRPAGELRPWYVNVDKVGEKQEKKTEKQIKIEKRRDERLKDLNDPMAIMRRRVGQLKEVEKNKQRIEGERKYELERLRMEQEELEEFHLGRPLETQEHSSRSHLDNFRNGNQGKNGRWRSRSSDYRPSIYKHRRQGRSRSPESSLDIAKDRKRWRKDGSYSRDRGHRQERSWDRDRDCDRNSEGSYRNHRSSERNNSRS